MSSGPGLSADRRGSSLSHKQGCQEAPEGTRLECGKLTTNVQEKGNTELYDLMGDEPTDLSDRMREMEKLYSH